MGESVSGGTRCVCLNGCVCVFRFHSARLPIIVQSPSKRLLIISRDVIEARTSLYVGASAYSSNSLEVSRTEQYVMTTLALST